MKSTAVKILSHVLLAFFIATSCNKDKFDFEKIKEIELNPEIWLPFGEVNLKLSDLKLDTSLISTDQDGFITVMVRRDSLIKSNLSQILNLPEQDTTNMVVQTGQSVTSDLSLRVFDNAEIKKIYFDTLEISWNLSTTAPQGTEISIQCLGSQSQSGNVQFSINNITHPSNQFHTSVFYNGFIDLSKNNTTFNTIQYVVDVIQSGSQTPSGTPIPFSFTISKIAVSGMEGFLGQSVLELPIFSSELNLRGLERFRQGIYFKNPKLELSFINSSGLELSLNPSINGANSTGNDVTILETPSIHINKSQAPGLLSVTQITLDNSNSNLSDMLRKVPEILITSGSVLLNPSGKQQNFLNKNSQIVLNGAFEIPLEFSAKDMFFETEVQNFRFWKNSSFELPEYVIFEFNSENGFPFELSLSAIFLDSVTNSPIKTFDLDILKPAELNQEGSVISSTKYLSSLRLHESDITAINGARSLLLHFRINTPDGGDKIVRIYDSNYFKTSISAKAKLKIKPLK